MQTTMQSILNPKQAKTIKELTAAANQAGLVPKLKINLVTSFAERPKDVSSSAREECALTPEIHSQRYTAANVLVSKRDTAPKITVPNSSHSRHKSALDAKPFATMKTPVDPQSISSVFKIREELR